MRNYGKKTSGRRRMMMLMISVSLIVCLCGCGKPKDQSVENIRSRGVLNVAIPNYDTSMLYYDEEAGAYRGEEAEIIDIIGSAIGVPVQYIPVDKAVLEQQVVLGTADIAIGRINQDSAAITDLGKTLSYGGEDLYVVTPRGVYCGDLSIFDNQTVGVSNMIYDSAYSALYYQNEIVINKYSSSDSVISDLSAGNIMGYVCYRAEAEYILSQGDFQIQNAPGITAESYVMVTAPESYALISGCNNRISAYLENSVSANWISAEENQ